MKLFHTGDWHIGKLINQLHLTADQDHVLAQLIELLREERPQALLLAGDLYDRSVPPVEAVELLDKVLSQIVLELEIPVLAIAGNHDSPDRLAFGSRLLQERGLHIAGRLTEDRGPITLWDEFGPVHFHLIPYCDPAIVRAFLKEPEIQTHDQAMAALLDRIRESMNGEERNVVMAHGLVIGGSEPETSDSERPLSLGGAEYIEARHFQGFDYVALGHLHSPQRVQGDRIRYAGSLMKYSFSEVNQKKSVTVVELKEKGSLEISERRLIPLKEMRKITGTLAQLLDPQVYGETCTEDYLMAVLTDRGELFDALGRLRAVYPNLLRLERLEEGLLPQAQRLSAGKDFARKTKLALFEEFYRQVTGQPWEAEKGQIVAEALKKVEGGIA